MTTKVRVELPVLLYVDVEIEIRNGSADAEDAAKAIVWQWMGKPGEEEGVDVPTPAHSPLSDARIYPSDHDWCDSTSHFDVVDDELVRTAKGEQQ